MGISPLGKTGRGGGCGPLHQRLTGVHGVLLGNRSDSLCVKIKGRQYHSWGLLESFLECMDNKFHLQVVKE